jgi:hypothetical protein
MHSLQYQTQSFLFMINSREELQLYKKQYCTSTSSRENPTFGQVDIGFLYHRQPLQLNTLKKFKYHEQTAFVELGCGVLRICNLAFFKGELLEFPENVRNCFEMEGEIWSTYTDNKIKLLITQGKIISHFIVVEVASRMKEEMVGVETTNENYVVYSRSGF